MYRTIGDEIRQRTHTRKTSVTNTMTNYQSRNLVELYGSIGRTLGNTPNITVNTDNNGTTATTGPSFSSSLSSMRSSKYALNENLKRAHVLYNQLNSTKNELTSTVTMEQRNNRHKNDKNNDDSGRKQFEYWRPEYRGSLVPKGDARNGSTLTDKLLYAATHTDSTQKRNIANLIAKERLYRHLFCGQTTNRQTDELNETLTTGNIAFIKYIDDEHEMNLETLCSFLETLIDRGYSLSYIFSMMKYLRRKYRGTGEFPKLRQQTSAFYRTLIDNYEQHRKIKPRIGTDEVYTCDERIYKTMYELAHDWFFDSRAPNRSFYTDERTDDNDDENGTRYANTLLFVYAFMFMYLTGKRLSDIALLDVEKLRTLLQYEALVIRIPKSKKLGRITLRGYDEQSRIRFRSFLRRAIDVFGSEEIVGKKQPIPFDQFAKRRTLDRQFRRLYNLATEKLKIAGDKPRGLSLHSLRRFRAATMFVQGAEIDNIRECLDHSSIRVTNMYINRHLMRSYRTANNEHNNNRTENTNRMGKEKTKQ